mmetsp:Transcript_23244/g.64831  ORF Transcript_23244/g.64831 Transcript_23244/m.64831 type:complete len:127 (-) Transcript_23244:232-612(-)
MASWEGIARQSERLMSSSLWLAQGNTEGLSDPFLHIMIVSHQAGRSWTRRRRIRCQTRVFQPSLYSWVPFSKHKVKDPAMPGNLRIDGARDSEGIAAECFTRRIQTILTSILLRCFVRYFVLRQRN